MPSLDGYSLNEEIKKVREELKVELLTLRNEFTELYSWIKKSEDTKKKPKKEKVKKVLEPTK